ncbi:hypothetical protein GCM10020295_48050 [Streptomyces cinereospinus]
MVQRADFAHLCAQLDAATGLGALAAYRASLDDLNDDVIEGDLLAQTVLKHAAGIDPGTEQRMTSAEWLHALTGLYTGEDFRPLPIKAGRPPARCSQTASSASSPPSQPAACSSTGDAPMRPATSESRDRTPRRPPPEQEVAF